jgi:L-amino acid N-acyltransferase YncA
MRPPEITRTQSTTIRSAAAADADAIAAIYTPYILNTIITFEEQPVSGAEMLARIDEVAGYSLPWLVAETDGKVVGYAYATKWKGRCAYRFSVETSVYLAVDQGGRGLGTLLYSALIAELKQRGMHSAIGGIALPNPASIALHEKLGFRQVARFVEVGFKFGRWIDVGYWQLQLSESESRREQ